MPSVWLVAVTMTASYQTPFSANPRIGFLAQARHMAERLATGSIAPDKVDETEQLIFNAQLNAGHRAPGGTGVGSGTLRCVGVVSST